MVLRMNHEAARARRRSFALALAAIAAGALACLTPAFATAEAPTAQASYYGLDWVPYIDPADLPPDASRPIVCLVDTGVAITNDLPADGQGAIMARLAVDGGSGLPFSQSWVDRHGTGMATYAYGANNGWGITGMFPQARVVSMRAQISTGGGLYYAAGARECRLYAGTHNLTIAAISMSLGADRPIDPSEQTALADEVAYSQQGNYNIVVGAGNSGAGVTAPGSYPGFLTAAAGVVGGSTCSYASYGSEVEIVGPSCGIDDVDAYTGATFQSNDGGASMATAVTSAVVALIRTLKPTATYSEIQSWITSGANIFAGRPLLNGVGAMHAAGLDPIVARARARQIVAHNPTPNPVDPPTRTLRTPRARVSFTRGFVRVKSRNRPHGARLETTLVFRKGEFDYKRVTKTKRSSSASVRSRKRPWRVEVRYRLGNLVSPTIRFRSRRSSTFVQLRASSSK